MMPDANVLGLMSENFRPRPLRAMPKASTNIFEIFRASTIRTFIPAADYPKAVF
jgi:hypothetical protein